MSFLGDFGERSLFELMLVDLIGELPFAAVVGDLLFDDVVGELPCADAIGGWPLDDETGETASPILPVPIDGANCQGVPSANPMVAIPRVDCVVENA